MRIESAPYQHVTSSTTSNPSSESGSELPPDFDVSKFQLAAERPSLGSYATPGRPGEFTEIKTPEEAWHQITHGTGAKLIAVPQVIPFGYEQVNNSLNEILAEHDLEKPAGTRISFGIAEDDQDGEVRFIVEDTLNPDDAEAKARAKAIQDVLNSGDYEYFTDSYLALDQLTAGQNISQANLRDSVLAQETASNNTEADSGARNPVTTYKQEFALKSDGTNWLMDVQLHKVELPPIEYVHTEPTIEYPQGPFEYAKREPA